jgi:hypothetical protein
MNKDKLIIKLGNLLSDISERYYYAGWLEGTEYYVPELCGRAIKSNSAQPWGHGEVTPAKAKKLVEISKELGHWVKLNDAGIGYESFNPFPIPNEILLKLNHELQLERKEDR